MAIYVITAIHTVFMGGNHQLAMLLSIIVNITTSSFSALTITGPVIPGFTIARRAVAGPTQPVPNGSSNVPRTGVPEGRIIAAACDIIAVSEAGAQSLFLVFARGCRHSH